jgi:hypothetical protein
MRRLGARAAKWTGGDGRRIGYPTYRPAQLLPAASDNHWTSADVGLLAWASWALIDRNPVQFVLNKIDQKFKN